jgi:hypothetical protein
MRAISTPLDGAITLPVELEALADQPLHTQNAALLLPHRGVALKLVL